MAKKELFNAKTQQVEEATLTVDDNNEIVATFDDGGVVKFPAGLTEKQFEKAIADHEKHSNGQEVITDEMEAEKAAERKKSLDLIGESEEAPAENADEAPQE